jgi:glycerol kinase
MAETGPVVIAVDQGTSATKLIATSDTGTVIATRSAGLAASHPRPGWVEQSAADILTSVTDGLAWSLSEYGGSRIAAFGLSTQRESAVAWDDATGEPLSPVLGWQDRRTIGRARELAAHAGRVREISGLPLSPMFSALKFSMILDMIDPDRARARAGRIKLGTVDSWLIRSLTGESRIEAGNASRTQLVDIRTSDWSDELLDLFDIPAAALPRIADSDEPTAPVMGSNVRVCAVLADSHAALYGHGVRGPGPVKATYGTGSSIMGLEAAPHDVAGVVRTIAWRLAGTTTCAFEGNILATGATIQWLAQLLGSTPAQVMEEARAGNSRIDVVPAFSGLGAPWWDEQAVGIVSSFDLGTSRADLCRAAAESIPLQIEDVLGVAEAAYGQPITEVLTDGGPSANDWLMQLQADLSQRTITRSDVSELSGLGVAHLAGTVSGVWTAGQIEELPRRTSTFHPSIANAEASARRSRWLTAVARSRTQTWPAAETVSALNSVHNV